MEEPNAVIRWTIFRFAGGDAGVWGLIGIAVIVGLALWPLRRRPVRWAAFGLILFVFLCFEICSPLPVPLWFIGLSVIWLSAVVLLFVVGARTKPATNNSLMTPAKPTRIQWLWFSSPFLWFALSCVLEGPYHVWSYHDPSVSTLLVIGDSVTAGLNDGEDTWPQQLARKVKLDILDASQPGATLRSARQQNRLFGNQPGLVVLEIGGNDMLEGLPVGEFEKNLEALLSEVVRKDRRVIMFELPLAPLCASYGSIQRRLAVRHRVSLIPKRSFATILTTQGSTVDGIHLSTQGQSEMATLMQSLLRLPVQADTGQYQRFENHFVSE